MNRKPWRIYKWGTAKEKGPGLEVINFLTVDNREYKYPTDMDHTTPLFTMKVSSRFTAEELEEYAQIICDRLNVEEVVEKLQGKS